MAESPVATLSSSSSIKQTQAPPVAVLKEYLASNVRPSGKASAITHPGYPRCGGFISLWTRTGTLLGDTSAVTILPRGPLPPPAIFAAAAALVMLIGLILDAVSLLSAVIVWVILAAYLAYSWRSGYSAK
jgi:hypothetical protein